MRPATLDIRIEPTDKTEHFNDHFTPYPSLKQLDISFHLYYGNWIPCGYFDFTKYPEDTRLAIKIRVPDTESYIEAPVSVACTIRLAASDHSLHDRAHGRKQKSI
jgi:hypothetical protein